MLYCIPKFSLQYCSTSALSTYHVGMRLTNLPFNYTNTLYASCLRPEQEGHEAASVHIWVTQQNTDPFFPLTTNHLSPFSSTIFIL